MFCTLLMQGQRKSIMPYLDKKVVFTIDLITEGWEIDKMNRISYAI